LKSFTSKIITAISIVFILVSIFLSGKLITCAKDNQQYRFDLAEINSIQYGLLNADEWKVALSEIITRKIEEFELTPENQEQLKEQVEALLYRLLDEVNEVLKNDMGAIKRYLVNAFVDLEELKENVPELSKTLLEELAKPENKENISFYLLGKLDTFVAETFNEDEQLRLNQLLEKYQFEDKVIASLQLQQLSFETTKKLQIDALLLVFFLLLVFLLNILYRNKN